MVPGVGAAGLFRIERLLGALGRFGLLLRLRDVGDEPRLAGGAVRRARAGARGDAGAMLLDRAGEIGLELRFLREAGEGGVGDAAALGDVDRVVDAADDTIG